MKNNAIVRSTRSLIGAQPWSTTRRGITRLLAGLALGGPLDLLGVKAEAKCKKKCGPCKRCKKRKCKPKPAGAPCADGTCQSGRCVTAGSASVPSPPLACGTGGPCRVFLSSTLHGGNLGGLRGADLICQGLAKDASLPGTYKAWLSDTTDSPSSRFVPSSGPYQLVNGTTIAATFRDLTDGTLSALIDLTETGGRVGSNPVAWTHTLINGTPGGDVTVSCENWNTSAPAGPRGNAGLATASGASWTAAGSSLCSIPRHLYCFQQS